MAADSVLLVAANGRVHEILDENVGRILYLDSYGLIRLFNTHFRI